MKAIGILAAAAALTALTACDQLGLGNMAGVGGGNEAAGNGAATNISADKPADNQLAADPGAGLGGKDPVAATPAGSQAQVALDRAYVMGRWTDDGDCDNAVDFLPDGRLVASNGREGLWNLAGDRLTMTVNSTITLQVVPIDQNVMNVVNPDGSLGRSTRC